MRYWFDGEDEDYERELQRVARCGGALPARMSLLCRACFTVLICVQLISFIAAILAIFSC